MNKPLAAHFGAGNVGRGLLGILLSQSGFDVVFVDVVEPLVDLLNNRERYTVLLVGPDRVQDISSSAFARFTRPMALAWHGLWHRPPWLQPRSDRARSVRSPRLSPPGCSSAAN